MVILVGSDGTKYCKASQVTTTRAISAAIPRITLALIHLNIALPTDLLIISKMSSAYRNQVPRRSLFAQLERSDAGASGGNAIDRRNQEQYQRRNHGGAGERRG